MSENYKALGTEIAQQTMKVVDRCFKSFFALINKAKSGSYQFSMINIPHYLDKEGWFSLIIPRITIKNGSFALPMSRDFKKEHGELRFIIPPNIADKEIKEIRIHPRNNARFFEIEYIYLQPKVKADVDREKFLGVDLGLDNLATCGNKRRGIVYSRWETNQIVQSLVQQRKCKASEHQGQAET